MCDVIGIPSVEEVKTKIHKFRQQFNALKNSTRKRLESRNADVKAVVDCLIRLPEDDMSEHKKFVKQHMNALLQAESLFKLFVLLNFYWNYLAYHLLEHLIKEFPVKEEEENIEKYTTELQQFIWATPLEVFCHAHEKRKMDLPPGFKELVVKFEWPPNVTLGVVEKFREQYACHYNLHKCAMMVMTMVPSSFFDVRHIPEPYLKRKMVEDALSKYEQVTNHTIHKFC